MLGLTEEVDAGVWTWTESLGRSEEVGMSDGVGRSEEEGMTGVLSWLCIADKDSKLFLDSGMMGMLDTIGDFFACFLRPETLV